MSIPLDKHLMWILITATVCNNLLILGIRITWNKVTPLVVLHLRLWSVAVSVTLVL